MNDRLQDYHLTMLTIIQGLAEHPGTTAEEVSDLALAGEAFFEQLKAIVERISDS